MEEGVGGVVNLFLGGPNLVRNTWLTLLDVANNKIFSLIHQFICCVLGVAVLNFLFIPLTDRNCQTPQCNSGSDHAVLVTRGEC